MEFPYCHGHRKERLQNTAQLARNPALRKRLPQQGEKEVYQFQFQFQWCEAGRQESSMGVSRLFVCLLTLESGNED